MILVDRPALRSNRGSAPGLANANQRIGLMLGQQRRKDLPGGREGHRQDRGGHLVLAKSSWQLADRLAAGIECVIAEGLETGDQNVHEPIMSPNCRCPLIGLGVMVRSTDLG